MFHGSCLHLFSDLILLVFILSLFERNYGTDCLLNHFMHLFLFGFVFLRHLHFEKCTKWLIYMVIFHPERRCPPFDSICLIVECWMVEKHSISVLVLLTLIVLQAVFELGVSFGWRVVFHVVHRVSRWVDLSVRYTSQAFVWWHAQEQIRVCYRGKDKWLSIEDNFLALGDRGSRWYELRPCFKLLLYLILRSVNHTGEPVIHKSLHSLSLFQIPWKINQDPSLRLYLCCQFKLSAQLLFSRWPTSAFALCWWSLSLGFGIGTSIGSLKFSKLLDDLLFFENVCFDLLDLSLLWLVMRKSQL